jgi:hypothetical protein
MQSETGWSSYAKKEEEQSVSRHTISDWINSFGGPFIAMEEAKASLWNRSNGRASDYDLACQSADYAGKLVLDGADVLVLGR